jgi:hypothetical protein
MAASLTKGRVCNLQCILAQLRVAQDPIPYITVSSETSPTWRVSSPIYIPQEQGDLLIPPVVGFILRHLLRLAGLRALHVEIRIILLPTVNRTVRLVVRPITGRISTI